MGHNVVGWLGESEARCARESSWSCRRLACRRLGEYNRFLTAGQCQVVVIPV